MYIYIQYNKWHVDSAHAEGYKITLASLIPYQIFINSLS